MEKWSDLEKWAEEITNKHIIKVLKESEYIERDMGRGLDSKGNIIKNSFNYKKREK